MLITLLTHPLDSYFGNWMRDFSQIVDPASVPCLPGATSEDCKARKGKFSGVEKKLRDMHKKIEKLATDEADDNVLQKALKKTIRGSAGKYFKDSANIAQFLGLAFQNRVTRKTWTRVGQVLWESKLEKMFEKDVKVGGGAEERGRYLTEERDISTGGLTLPLSRTPIC